MSDVLPVGSEHTYTGVGSRSVGNGVLEEYDLVQPCVVLRVDYSANFPAVPRYVVRLANGSELYAYAKQLT